MPKSRKDKGHYGRPYLRMRAEVFAREAVCYLCGHPVDKSLFWKLPGAPQLHLIIPITRGGSWRDKNNCRLTHRLCNIRQQNKLDGTVRHDLQEKRVDTHWIIAEEP